MIPRKIDAMHLRYGMVEGKQCKDCPLFREGYYHDRKLMKCSAYGMTNSEATDWRKKLVACGLIDNPHQEDTPVIDRLRWQRECVVRQVPGQISMKI